jgi:predicted small lipoprotein YifL
MQSQLKMLLAAGLLSLGLAACDDKGPLEQAGEEVDEAIDTVQRGEESNANKADDAVDDLREGAQDAGEEISKD